jgi:uncharacterized protein (TIGR00290 family)
MPRERIVVSWSGGKDSCLMLHDLIRSDRYEIAALLCMVREPERRISMHGVPFGLLQAQAHALGLPLHCVGISPGNPYETGLAAAVADHAARGATRVAYGDLFLADIRAYREKLHARIGLECLFPLWGRDTRAVAEGFLAAGYEAIVTCVDARKLDIGFAGRAYDRDFLADLPESVDPAGENGEFHTFVHAGPLFREPVRFRAAAPIRTIYTDVGHAFELGFCDLSPDPAPSRDTLPAR